MSKRLEFFPGKKSSGSRAPAIKAPSAEPTFQQPRQNFRSGGGEKPNWKVQRELEEQRRQEELAKIQYEKEQRMKGIEIVREKDTPAEDPILARIRGGYDITVEESEPVEITMSEPVTTRPSVPVKQTPQSFEFPTSPQPPANDEEYEIEIQLPDPAASKPPPQKTYQPVISEPPKPKPAPTIQPSVPASRNAPSNNCNSCGKPLSGAVIQAKGQSYHQQCFNCAGCGTTFSGGIMIYEIDGKPFCGNCKAQKTQTPSVATPGASCGKCGQSITGTGVEALGQLFHQQCFTCASCDKAFLGGHYVSYKGNPYCKSCAERQAEIDTENEMGRCGGCGGPFTSGKVVNISGINYHHGCFMCTTCRKPFEKEYFLHDNKPYCANCNPGD